jgi:hypothetical protein
MPIAAEYSGRLARLEGRQLESGSIQEPEAFTEFVKIRNEGPIANPTNGVRGMIDSPAASFPAV